MIAAIRRRWTLVGVGSREHRGRRRVRAGRSSRPRSRRRRKRLSPLVALALVPALVVAIALTLDREMFSATTVALLGVLAAVGAAIRIAGTGVGGIEAVFILLILAGRAYGARFGFLLGMLTIALSSVLWGGFGPWTPFQVFACGWVAAGAAAAAAHADRRTRHDSRSRCSRRTGSWRPTPSA